MSEHEGNGTVQRVRGAQPAEDARGERPTEGAQGAQPAEGAQGAQPAEETRNAQPAEGARAACAPAGAGDAHVRLAALGGGAFAAPGARIIDRSGRRRMPIGRADFTVAMRQGVLVDKTMLIADVLDRSYGATLFCRPRRFGKTLNMTMMKAYFEAPGAGGLAAEDARAVFEHTEVWDADGGCYRRYQGAYPVVHLSLRTAKGATWDETLSAIRDVVSAEYLRHRYLREAGTPLPAEDVAYFNAVAGRSVDADLADSLAALCRMLRSYHGKGVVVLIDEYDAPVMAAYSAPDGGYYDRVVGFLKRWLTGALKDGGEALAFACLTGVQRISKESIFSDLNNLYVSTALNTRFDERYGFTDAEVAALLSYMGRPDRMAQAREWYDGYRFGDADVYNPWSVASYIDEGCTAGNYWTNTSSNSVIGDLVSNADDETLSDVYTLMEPSGAVYEPLDLGVVFPDIGIREGALWSMLYLSGYVTTDDVEDPSDETRLRPLRIPDFEVSRIFNNEIVRRFRMREAGGVRRLASLHHALVAGDADAFERELGRIALNASAFDLTSENSCHMLVMGLLFGVPGYRYPVSNREAGYGRYDIRLEPDATVPLKKTGSSNGLEELRPLITVEMKFMKPSRTSEEPDARKSELDRLAQSGLTQIEKQGYDSQVPEGVRGRLRWGVAFSGKHVAAACDWA